jgi:hypothetical protein
VSEVNFFVGRLVSAQTTEMPEAALCDSRFKGRPESRVLVEWVQWRIWGKDPVENPRGSAIIFAAFLSGKAEWNTQKRCGRRGNVAFVAGIGRRGFNQGPTTDSAYAF